MDYKHHAQAGFVCNIAPATAAMLRPRIKDMFYTITHMFKLLTHNFVNVNISDNNSIYTLILFYNISLNY